MSLRVRIALLFAGVAFGVGVVSAGAAYLSTGSQLRSTVDDTLTGRAAFVTDEDHHGHGGPDGGGGPDDDGHCPQAGSFSPASAAQIVTDDGAVSVCIQGGTTLPIDAAEQSLADGQVRLRTVSVDGERYRLLSTPWPSGGTLQIARGLAETDDVLAQLRLELLALVAIASAVAAGIGWAVATHLTRPIVRLRDDAHRIAGTLDLATPVDTTGPGEVGSLAVSFSTMVDALRRSRDQQQRLVADASHEMRTPLTSLRSNVELIRQIERLPASEREEVVSDVLEDVDELSTLLSEIVDLASDLATAEPEELVSLGDLARTAAARTERRTGRTVEVDDRTTGQRPGRPRQLERAIGNLVDNAVKYSAEGDPVAVVVDDVSVTVLDRGRGIAPGDLERVFDRFYRAVDVRTQPGSGLGLSIVDEIVRAHQGAVFARNREGGGAEVGFTLPTPP